MIEFSIADMFLLGWAIVATVAWHKARQEEKMVKHFAVMILKDKKAREELTAKFEEVQSMVDRS